MAGQAHFNHKQLQNKKSNEVQDMLFEKGVNWNNYPVFFKRGTFVKKRSVEKVNPLTGEDIIITEIYLPEWPELTKIQNSAEILVGNVKPILKSSEICQ